MKIALPVAIATLAAQVARPSVAAVITNSTVPQSGSFTNPCNGDPMTFEGFLHTVATTTFDASGGFQTHISVNEEQTKDTDTLTGVVCSDTLGSATNTHNIVFGGPFVGLLPVVVSFDLTTTTNCPGSVGSFKISVLLHVTVNANGTLTVFNNPFGIPTLVCK
jgi:hypothetical protein